MRPAQRRLDPGVIQQLLTEPHRFEFFQAVRLLEHWLEPAGRVGRGSVVAERLVFLNSPSLAFPASEVAGLAGYDRDGKLLADPELRARAVRDGELSRIEITPAFFGLLGGQGAMPVHYSETVAARESQQRDRGPRAFLDIFSNRAAALFYAAWKKYRMPVRHETERDHHYLPLLLSLAGLGHRALRDRLHEGGGEVFDESLAHYAAAVRQRPVSAVFLQRVLADYFGHAVRIEQFVGKWYDLPPEHRTRLGSPNAVLGVSAQVGERVWQRDLCMRIWVGPLSREAFAGFLPGAGRAQALAKLVTMLAGLSFEYEVRLILRKDQISGSALGSQDAGLLGWNTFLCSTPPDSDRADTSYELQVFH